MLLRNVPPQELEQFGVRSRQHRIKLMDGRGLIHLEVEDTVAQEDDDHDTEEILESQPFSASQLGRSYSQISSASSTSSTVQRQTLEVLRIQLKKTYSNSSSSSNGSFGMDC